MGLECTAHVETLFDQGSISASLPRAGLSLNRHDREPKTRRLAGSGHEQKRPPGRERGEATTTANLEEETWRPEPRKPRRAGWAKNLGSKSAKNPL